MSKRRRPRAQANFELEVAGWSSPDVDFLESWVPGNPEDVFYCLELEIGPAGGGGTDLFQALVATPQGLQAYKEKHGRLHKPDQQILFVFPEYSWKAVEQKVLETVADCTAADFIDSLVNLRKHFAWEYDDYRG